jgi:integrase/recombinase XerD
MKCIIENQVVLSQPPVGPIAAQIGSFAKSMGKQGYSLVSIHRQVFLAACFSRWLKRKGIRLRSICSDHPAQYLRYRARHARPGRGDAAALTHLIGFLRSDGLIPAEKRVACRPIPAERCAQAFGQYLLEERALAHATIINYVPFIRTFLEVRFGSGRVELSRLCASDVVRFVQRQAPRLRMKRAKLMTTALRSFLNYGRYLGEVSLDLAAAVPIVAN